MTIERDAASSTVLSIVSLWSIVCSSHEVPEASIDTLNYSRAGALCSSRKDKKKKIHTVLTPLLLKYHFVGIFSFHLWGIIREAAAAAPRATCPSKQSLFLNRKCLH